MADGTLLGIVGSVSAGSRTRTAVEVALDATADRDGVETDVLRLADYDLDTADGDLRERLATLGEATTRAVVRNSRHPGSG